MCSWLRLPSHWPASNVCASAQVQEDAEDALAPAAAHARGERVAAFNDAIGQDWLRAACEPQYDQLRPRSLATNPGERSPLERLLGRRITELKGQCALTDAQVKKLELAGNGDIKRFVDRLEALARKLEDTATGLDGLRTAFADCEALRNSLNNGLFGDGSLLAKTLRKTLSPEQAASRDRSIAQERLQRYERLVRSAVKTLQGNLALRDEQGERLVRQLLTHSRPPKQYGRVFEFAFVVFQLSRLPEDTIKPIFQDRQWRELQGWFAPYRGPTGAHILEQDGFSFDVEASLPPPRWSPPPPLRDRPPPVLRTENPYPADLS